MKKKAPMQVPKPRATVVNEVLLSKKGGRHVEKSTHRSNRKHEARREINASLKGSKWSPFCCAAAL